MNQPGSPAQGTGSADWRCGGAIISAMHSRPLHQGGCDSFLPQSLGRLLTGPAFFCP